MESYPAVQFRVARPTSNLEEVARFYTEGLKLKVLSRFEGHDGYTGVIIGLPGIEYHLEFTQDHKGTTGGAPSKDNLLVLYFRNGEELSKVKNSLERLGYYPVEPENPYWKGKSYTYEDPDGWRVVLFNGLYQPGYVKL